MAHSTPRMPDRSDVPESRFYALHDMLVDPVFPDLAARLDPGPFERSNLSRLMVLLDRITEKFPPGVEIVSGFRSSALNEKRIAAGLPASVDSLHMRGCAADVRPKDESIDPELIFDWLSRHAEALMLHEAVFYPKKGIIHVAVLDPRHPTPRRILMRT